ncbi:MAG: hypothetical protein ACUVTM_01890 [Candidatus Bathyarchaeia archaeon]
MSGVWILYRFKWLLLSACSGVAASGLVLYYVWKYPNPSFYGEQFILDEWAPMIFIQFKPITLIFILLFLFYAFLIQHFQARIASLGHEARRFLLIISFLVVAGSLYELFFNFTLWGALMVTTGLANPDILVNRFPNLQTAVSIVYASKIVLLIFAVSLYSIYFLNRIDKPQ